MNFTQREIEILQDLVFSKEILYSDTIRQLDSFLVNTNEHPREVAKSLEYNKAKIRELHNLFVKLENWQYK